MAAWIVVLACVASTAAAQDTKVGFSVGAAVPVSGIALQEPELALSGWLSRPIDGPWGWRVELGGARLQRSDRSMFRCAAAGFYCDAILDVAFLSGGLQIEPRAGKALAPYGYATVGVHRLSGSAEAQDLHGASMAVSYAWDDTAFGIALGSGVRVRLNERATLRGELRYAGFRFKPGTQHWASLVTPTLTTSVAF